MRPPLTEERRVIARKRWTKAWQVLHACGDMAHAHRGDRHGAARARQFALMISKMEIDRRFNAAVHGVPPVDVRAPVFL